MGNQLGIRKDRVKKYMKNEGFINYWSQTVEALKRTDKIAKVTFAQLIFELVSLSPNFLERIMF